MKSRCRRRRRRLREPRARVITMRADVAAEGKARLPFLFLGLGPRTKREKEKMQTHESVWVSDTKCTPSGQKLSTNSAFTFRQGSLTRPERHPDPPDLLALLHVKRVGSKRSFSSIYFQIPAGASSPFSR